MIVAVVLVIIAFKVITVINKVKRKGVLMMDNLSSFVETVKAKEALGVAKANDILNIVKASELLKKEEEDKKRAKTIVTICGIIIGIVAVAAIAYGIYCYFTPDYLDDFEDEFEDDDYEPDFEDEFFEPDKN